MLHLNWLSESHCPSLLEEIRSRAELRKVPLEVTFSKANRDKPVLEDDDGIMTAKTTRDALRVLISL